MARTVTKALDLGTLQSNLEQSASTLKSATTSLNKAKEQHKNADAAYSVAKKALAAGVEQLSEATKVG